MSGILTAVRDFTKNQGNVREVFGKKSCQGKWPKTVYCIFASIFDFAECVHFILVLDHALLHSYPHH